MDMYAYELEAQLENISKFEMTNFNFYGGYYISPEDQYLLDEEGGDSI